MPETERENGSEDRRWVAIAANPFSGSGPTKMRVAELAKSLRRCGLEPRVIWDRAERSALLRNPESLQGCRCVVAAGGDGTVADVINELSAPVSFATLPLGNENLFAREFGFNRNGKLLARSIAAGRTRAIDLGRGGDRLFSLMLSVGFDAAVVHQVAAWRAGARSLKRVSRLSYTKPIVTVLRSYQYYTVELDADGVRATGTHAFVFNLPQYGFQLPFAPAACGDDGLLDWIVFDYAGLVSAFAYLLSLLGGKHLQQAGVYHGRARQIRISGAAAVPVQADGDPCGHSPIEVRVQPRALRVVVM